MNTCVASAWWLMSPQIEPISQHEMWDRGPNLMHWCWIHPSLWNAHPHFRFGRRVEAAKQTRSPEFKTQARMKRTSRIALSLFMMVAALSSTRATVDAADQANAAELLQNDSRESNDTSHEFRSDAGDAPVVHSPVDNSEMLRAAPVQLKNCIPADKEPWIATVKSACVFLNPTSGFTYFYKLSDGSRFRNCFCNNDGASGFRGVFKENALTSTSKKNTWCYIKGLKRTWILPDMKSDFAYAFEPFEERPECE